MTAFYQLAQYWYLSKHQTLANMKNSNDSILLTLALIAIDMELKAILEEDLQIFRAKQAGQQIQQPVQQAA